jgi:hypothetical protein
MLRSTVIGILITLLVVACSSPAASSVPVEPVEESSVSVQDEAPVEDGAAELGDFVSAPDMKARRERFAAIRLSDGSVLALGGRGLGIGTLIATMHETAELLNPETLEWTMTGVMAEGRRSPAMVELEDGRVLVAGGLLPTKFTTQAAEIWDPTEGVWTTVAPMHRTRDGMGAVRLPDGRVMVVGGKMDAKLIGTLDQSEIYDVDADTWTEAAPMSEKRLNHTVTLLLDGRVLVTGGGKEDGPFSKTAETYDSGTDTWKTVAPMTVSRSFHTATLLEDGRVLVVGGRGKRLLAELYDPITDVWSSAGETEAARAEHSAVRLLDGRVLVIGGLGSLTESEIYDPVANEWSTGSPLKIGRYRSSTVLLSDGRVVTFGGIGAEGILASSEVLAWR